MKKNKIKIDIELTQNELDVLNKIAKKKGMNQDQAMRQAIRIFQIVETLSDEGAIDLGKIMNDFFNLNNKKLKPDS